MLLIYCEHITPRINYVFHFVLTEIAGFTIRLTQDKNEYLSSTEGVLNYSKKSLKKSEILIKPNGLLSLDTIVNCQPAITRIENNIRFYFQSEFTDETIFDPFAASFYLVTRYEEYFPFAPDRFDRFEAKASCLYQNGLLENPLINIWAEEIKNQVVLLNPNLTALSKKFNSIITIDVDQAFAFKHRGIKRNILAFLKNLYHFNGRLLAEQFQTLIGVKKDPYDTYEYLKRIQEDSKLKLIYFINVGQYSEFDKNLDHRNSGLRSLLQAISKYAFVGIHPSYYSNQNPSLFLKEKNIIESIVQQKVTKSRQHYLKLNFPHTYRSLIEAGIEEDYTMGYASYPGFRSGTCTPFFWFDLEKNCTTTLKVFPVTYMEGTLGEDLNMNASQALDKICSLIDTVKKYNGCCVSIWHNHTLNDSFTWKHWISVFEKALKHQLEY